jgi:hypothetical protein
VLLMNAESLTGRAILRDVCRRRQLAKRTLACGSTRSEITHTVRTCANDKVMEDVLEIYTRSAAIASLFGRDERAVGGPNPHVAAGCRGSASALGRPEATARCRKGRHQSAQVSLRPSSPSSARRCAVV